MRTARDWIEALTLERHPEGGWFKEVYRSTDTLPESALPKGFNGTRAIATSIYFLLESDDFSAFHRIRSDETWHHYEGQPVTIHSLADSLSTVIIGHQPGQMHPQTTIPAGTWFSAELEADTGYALLGCSVAPGFDFTDFELAQETHLTQHYPPHTDLIARLTRS